MIGWDISRHLESDMMCAAGLTVREIADLCRANVATVHMHLKVREEYAPGLQAIHNAALKDRVLDRPTTRLRKNLEDVISFHSTYGRLPRSNGETNERKLFNWVSDQRRKFEQGQMSAAKVSLLQDLSD